MGPPDEAGGMGVGSFQVGEQTRPRLAMSVDRMLPIMLNTGDFDEKKWAESAETYRNMMLGDQVLSGERKAGDVGRAQAAVKGSELFKADAGGGVLDLFGGTLDTNNPMATATIGLKKEQAGAQRASAAQSYASANASNAQAQRTRAEMAAAGAGSGTFKAPTGYRWKSDGTGLEPIPGGPADPSAKNSKPPAEVQRMNIALRALEDGLTRYEQILGEFDPRSADQMDPGRKAQIESLTADLRMQMKEAQALGALTGPDMQILDQMLTNPATVRGAYFGRDGLNRQVSEARLSLQRRRNALAAEFNQQGAAGGVGPSSPVPARPASAPAQPSLADLAAAELARRGNR
jgi:hypothetical protein